MNGRPFLHALAERAGILAAFTDAQGLRRQTADVTREALLAAFGFDASTEELAARAVESFDRLAGGLLSPVDVTPVLAPRVRVNVPAEATASVAWSVQLVAEDGHTREQHGLARTTRSAVLEIPIDPRPEFGYYDARVTIRFGDHLREGEQLLIVAPPACLPCRSRPSDRRFGISANLYALRGRNDWGIGDLGQLRTLIDFAASARAAFVGINPLHAILGRGQWVSPYSPVTRLFRNPLYIDITQVPELTDCAAAREQLASAEFIAERDRLRNATHIDYAAVMRSKRSILQSLHEQFERSRSEGGTARADGYDRYVERHREYLVDFATFCALDDRYSQRDPPFETVEVWPIDCRSAQSPGSHAFRQAHPQRIGFHCWLQYELDRQMADAAGHARRSGLDIGLFGDLAIASAAGADQWARAELFAQGATIGAPPDDYSATGQNWGLPPFNPLRLARDRFAFLRAIIRNALEHPGALRIDHVMGLFRQFWIPAGRTAVDGAYVRFPAEELLAILAIESVRARTIIIGEDLGTVPEGLAQRLARWNILSTRVLYFERERNGAFRASRRYSRRSLVSANTHDAPPLAGYWNGQDLLLRRSLGMIDEAGFQDGIRARLFARDALVRALVTERILPPGARPGNAELATGVYRFLAHTPSPLLAVSFDDLAGETDPINLPGVSWLRYPSWTRRSRLAVEDVAADPDAMRILSGVRERLPRSK